jgi:putative ABC transport system permease protein
VAGIFRSFSKEYDDRVVRVWLPTAQELIDSNGVNVVVVQLKATEQTDAVLSAIRAGPVGQGVDVQPWYRLSEFYANTRLLYERQFGVLQASRSC